MFVNKQRRSVTKHTNHICNIRNSQDTKSIASRFIILTSAVEVSTMDLISSVLSWETKWNKLQQRQARGLFEETRSPMDIGHRTGLIGVDLPCEFTNPEENRLMNRKPSGRKTTMSQVRLKAKAETMKTWHQASPCQGSDLAQCRTY